MNYSKGSFVNTEDFKQKRFNTVESDIDFATLQRSFSGRITKKRYKILDSYCRKYSYRPAIYSDYDCTGLLCSHNLSFAYKQNQVIITLSLSFDC